MSVQTGNWTRNDSILALYRFYVNSADHELVELGIERLSVLGLIRALEQDQGEYRNTELLTIATQLVRAYVLGVESSGSKAGDD